MNQWKEAQVWESDWWGNCVNTLQEENKQIMYADRMGLIMVPSDKTPYVYDLDGATVLDVGGGPVSLLLKCVNVDGYVVDPILRNVPIWVRERYREAGIQFSGKRFESLDLGIKWDEAWIYNVLLHVEDPKKIIKKARKVAKLIRIFEWLNSPKTASHPSTLREEELNEWLEGEGKVEKFKEQRPQMQGIGYYGIFPRRGTK